MQFKYKKTVGLIVAVFLLVVDRFLKALSIKFQSDLPFDLIEDLLQFDYVENYFIALSIPLGGIILVFISAIIIVGLLIWFIKLWPQKKSLILFFLSLIILGAISNLYDRVVLGYVVDYLGFKYLFTNNLADIMIFGGVFGFLFQTKNNPE